MYNNIQYFLIFIFIPNIFFLSLLRLNTHLHNILFSFFFPRTSIPFVLLLFSYDFYKNQLSFVRVVVVYMYLHALVLKILYTFLTLKYHFFLSSSTTFELFYYLIFFSLFISSFLSTFTSAAADYSWCCCYYSSRFWYLTPI